MVGMNSKGKEKYAAKTNKGKIFGTVSTITRENTETRKDNTNKVKEPNAAQSTLS